MIIKSYFYNLLMILTLQIYDFFWIYLTIMGWKHNIKHFSCFLCCLRKIVVSLQWLKIGLFQDCISDLPLFIIHDNLLRSPVEILNKHLFLKKNPQSSFQLFSSGEAVVSYVRPFGRSSLFSIFRHSPSPLYFNSKQSTFSHPTPLPTDNFSSNAICQRQIKINFPRQIITGFLSYRIFT